MFVFECMSWARGSIARAKRRGERGQPCLVPLSMEKGSERNPIYETYAFGLWYREEIHFRKCIPNPHQFKIELR